jgi:hypothetical protein
VGSGNTPGRRSPSCVQRAFSFGWSAPGRYASSSGEIGGQFVGSGQYRASYAEVLPTPATLDDPLTASGTLALVKTAKTGGPLLGWFNSATSFGWRTPDFLGLRLIAAGGSGYNVVAEYGTSDVFAGAANPSGKLKRGRSYPWTLSYSPTGGDFGTGLLSFTIGGFSSQRSIIPPHRLDRARFDRFGIINGQYDAPSPTVYIGDLVIGGVAVDLSHDPGWEAIDTNLAGAPDCRVSGRQDFGYSPTTSFAGGDPGEIGGMVWRVDRKASWYADRVGPLGPGDTLFAEDRIVLENAWTDSDLLIGWFDSQARTPPRARFSSGIIGADVGADSKWGYRFFPVFSSDRRTGATYGDDENAPMLTPFRTPLRFWICYEPAAGPLLNATITVGIQNAHELQPATETTLPIRPDERGTGAVFDRFGIRSVEVGGLSAKVFLDDLRYTTGSGDVAPPDRCESG